MIDKEVWLPISGTNGRYEVSNQGNVRCFDGKSLLLRCFATKPGGPQYRRVHIPSPVSRNYYVHRLVLETFIGPCPKGMQCRHLNGNSLDNRLANLQWGTPSQDNYDRVRHGTHQHTKRAQCKYGHSLDGVAYRKDGTVKQRFCRTCFRIRHRKRRAAKMTCPQGHPFDGIRYKADGTVRQRYCKTCVNEQLERSRGQYWAQKTHCPKGHPLDGVWGSGARYCKTCHRERTRDYKARKRAGEPMGPAGKRRIK